jgi:hypothetical protein
METECMEMVENMDVVDAVRKERIERVRLRQLEWECRMMCKGLVMEMVDRSAEMSERRVSSDIGRQLLEYVGVWESDGRDPGCRR